jgi:hypothetical protein
MPKCKWRSNAAAAAVGTFVDMLRRGRLSPIFVGIIPAGFSIPFKLLPSQPPFIIYIYMGVRNFHISPSGASDVQTRNNQHNTPSFTFFPAIHPNGQS